MATFTASAAQSTQPAVYAINQTISRTVRYSKSASDSAGDVIQMVRVPIGAIVNHVAIAVSFSAGVSTVNVGDGNDVSAYAASVVLSGSVISAVMPMRALGRSYSAEDTIDIQIAAISTPPANALYVLTVNYTCTDHGGT